MNDESLLYGCRSGIQKAIRRSDLHLADFCFNTLWDAGKPHREWLITRIPVLCTEDCYLLAGEIASLSSGGLKDKETVHKIIRRLTLFPAAKDAAGLTTLLLWDYPVPNAMLRTDEYGTGVRVLSHSLKLPVVGELSTSMPPYAFVLEAAQHLALTPLTKYELSAIKYCYNRAVTTQYGGYADDRWQAIVAALLIGSRRIADADIKVRLKNATRDLAADYKASKPVTELPWYVWDKHTRVGKMAISAVVKHKNPNFLDADQLAKLQFFCSSAHVVNECLSIAKVRWWTEFKTIALIKRFSSVEKAWKMWGGHYESALQNAIIWALTKA